MGRTQIIQWILEDFGVKIFLPKNLDNAETNLNFIYDEFAEWNKRSGRNA